jgi:outer membrane protein TolC
MHASWLALLVLLTASAPPRAAADGQEALNLLIEKALQSNPELLAALSYRDALQAEAKSAGALPDPVLSAGPLNLPVNSLSLSETPMSGFSVGLTQGLPWPGKLRSRSRYADLHSRQAQAHAAEIENRLVREVTDAYMEF